ncbi:MAG: hypothetical protein ABI584_09335 [Acidobacteriota bacterium]
MLKRFSIFSPVGMALSLLASACAPAWREYRSEDADFTIELPGEPCPSSHHTGPLGERRDFRGVETWLQGAPFPSPHFGSFRVWSYQVVGSISTPDEKLARLNEVRDEELRDVELHPTLVSDTALQGATGREIEVTLRGDFRLVERNFLHNGRIYRIAALEDRSASRAYVDRFLASFRFTESKH